MADSPHRAGTGKDEGRKKRRPSSTGDSEDAQQEESPAAGPEEEATGPEEEATGPEEEATGPEEEATGPEEAHRPPPLYGYDPDQWPEPH